MSASGHHSSQQLPSREQRRCSADRKGSLQEKRGSVGTMDPAFFVGRREILAFINGTLGLSLSKVEETCSGAVACNLLDSIHPGVVQMSKVDWTAQAEPEYINNYKLLQQAFDTLGIDKGINVAKLSKGKYMDSLEFCQWFKWYYESSSPSGDYDAAAQRERGRGGKAFNMLYGSEGGGRRDSGSGAVAQQQEPLAVRGSGPGAQEKAKEQARYKVRDRPAEAKVRRSLQGYACDGCTQLEAAAAALARDRDFYFAKLRDMEVLLLQAQEERGGAADADGALLGNLFKILYATKADFEDQADGGAAIAGGDSGSAA